MTNKDEPDDGVGWDPLSDIGNAGLRDRVRNIDNIRERSIAGLITAFIIAGLVISGSPAGAVSTSIDITDPNRDLADSDNTIEVTYNIDIEAGERIPIDGYEFDFQDSEDNSATIEYDATDDSFTTSSSSSSIDETSLNPSLSNIETSYESGNPGYGYGDLNGYGYGYG